MRVHTPLLWIVSFTIPYVLAIAVPAPGATAGPDLANAQRDHAVRARATTAPAPLCTPFSSPDDSTGNVCVCNTTLTYPQLTRGTTPVSEFNPCNASKLITTKTTAVHFSSAGVPNAAASALAAMDTDQYDNCTTLYKTSDWQSFCWRSLSMTDYVNNWVSSHSCPGNGQSPTSFAECFYTTAFNQNKDCTQIGGDSCVLPDFGQNNETDPLKAAQANYFAYNIWNVNNYFYEYFQAVTGAATLVGDDIATINQTLSTSVPNANMISTLLTVLSFGLAVIPIGDIVSELPAGLRAAASLKGGKGTSSPGGDDDDGDSSSFGTSLAGAIQGSPGLAKALMAPPSDPSQTLDIAVDESFGTLVNDFQNNMASALPIIMNNHTLFLQVVQDGSYSANHSGQADYQDTVRSMLRTYVVSQTLQKLGVFMTRAVDTDVNQLQLNSSKDINTAGTAGCGSGYDEWGQCGNWWYSEGDNISYGLQNNNSEYQSSNYTNSMTKLFELNITTPELIYQGSQYCAAASGTTQGQMTSLSLSSGGAWNIACISNMAVCTWDLTSGQDWRKRMFTDCPNFGGKWPGILNAYSYLIPPSYIGPAMFDKYIVYSNGVSRLGGGG